MSHLVSKRCSRCPEMMHYVPPEQTMHERCRNYRPCPGTCGTESTGYEICSECRPKFSVPSRFRAYVDALIEGGRLDTKTQFVCQFCVKIRSQTDDVHFLLNKGYTQDFSSPYKSPKCDACFRDTRSYLL
jgi:hypothetical protein